MAHRVGQQLGNYRLLHLLGRGGFAEVYLAEHTRLNIQAAVKVLQTRPSSKEEVESFQNEARAIARLIHPHIVRVFDFDVEQGVPFLVMDYAPHGTLRKLHPRGERLSLITILSYVEQVADALQYAHDQLLIHRDIKPENLLLGRNDEVLLSDFGTALLIQSTSKQFTEQQVVGTVAYLAPERTQGKSCPASDQYALAAVVYEWLCGYPPFQGSPTEVALQHTMAPPAPLHDQLPSLLPGVEQVVLRALAKDPHQRFPRVQDFALALKQASQSGASFFSAPTLAGAPLPPINAPSPSQPPATSHKRKAGLAVLLLLALLTLVGGAGLLLGGAYMHLPGQQPPGYPQVAGTYKGVMVDPTSDNSTVEMSLSLQQNQGTVSGQFMLGPQPEGNSLLSKGLLTGTVDPANHMQFTVQSAEGDAPLFFDGSVQSDGSLAGTYCSLGTNAQCSSQAGASGTWKVSKK